MKKIFALIWFVLIYNSTFAFIQIVNVQNTTFSPNNFTMNFGDTVKWVWVNGTHTTTSITVPSGAATWDNPISAASPSFIYVPAKTGSYSYKCTPHFSFGMTGSFTVVCPVVTANAIASGPTVFCSGGSVNLVASATGGNIYKWQKNGVNISGSNSAIYKAKSTGTYRVNVSNLCGSSAVSPIINVTVNSLPGATISPADTVYICSGDSVKLNAITGNGNTFQWYRYSTAISGANAVSFTAKAAGNYKVKVTKTATGCSKTSAVTKVIINCKEGLGNLDGQAYVNVFPNPTTDFFNLELIHFGNISYHATVYDATGKMITRFGINEASSIFGNGLMKGLYILEISDGNQFLVRKRIIKMN